MNDYVPQQTAEWFASRVGCLTASTIGDLMARTQKGFSASRANLIMRLVCERLTGIPQSAYVSAAMQHGIDNEAPARAAYELRTGAFVELVGFVPHPEIVYSGASPDGMVDDDGLLEIKCPTTPEHVRMLLGGAIERGYILQMQWQMACAGRAWCDFCSFDPRLPDHLRLFIKRIPRDDALIAEIATEVRNGLDEITAMIALLNQQQRVDDSAPTE